MNNEENLELPKTPESNRRRTKPFSSLVGQIGSVYHYHNTYHDKHYIGQTTNTADRMVEHPSELARNEHRTAELQKDYNELLDLGLDPNEFIKAELLFRIDIIQLPNQLEFVSIKKNLLEKEKSFIKQFRNEGKYVYGNNPTRAKKANKKKTSSTGKVAYNAKPCKIMGINYPSVTAAANSSEIKLSIEVIRSRLDNPNYRDWIRLEPPQKQKKIKIKREERNEGYEGLPRGVLYKTKPYSSIRECNRLTGISTHKIQEGCDDFNNTEFEWIKDKENRLSDKAKSSVARPLSIDGHEFSSINEAWKSDYINKTVTRRTIESRCSSNKKNPDWFFL